MIKLKSKSIVVREKEVSLPSAPTSPSEDLCDYTWLIYGERKIGKTSLVSCFEDVYFLKFDPADKHLKIRQSFCKDWKTFLKYIELLEAKPEYCKTVVLDTGFMLYERCFEFCLKELHLDSPQDEAWGNAWKYIDREFRAAHDRIGALGTGLVVLAHSEVKEIKQKGGFSYTKITTQLGGQAYRYYGGTMDILAYYHYNSDGERFLRIRGTSDYDAGIRTSGHFLYTNGERVEEVPMGNSEQEAFDNLSLAFGNKLTQKKEGGVNRLGKLKLKLKK